MGAYRYCSACGCGQDRITLDEIEHALTMSEFVKCGCGADRGDDDFNERFSLLLEEVIRLREIVERKNL